MLTLLHIAMARQLAEDRIRDLQRDAPPRRYPQEDVPSVARVLAAPLPRDDCHGPEREVAGNKDAHARRRRGAADAARRSTREGADRGR
jgi:hypothetical protein